MAKKFYAVRKGYNTGIYESWDECKKQTSGFSGAEFKSFPTKEEAMAFIEGRKSDDNAAASEAIAYVDGSFLVEKSMFSFGAVLFHNGEEKHFSKAFDIPDLVSMRNVAGEIKGAEFVMQYCLDNNIASIDIYYDYEGIEKWCIGAWKANKSGTQRYAEFYKNASKSVKINFIKVRGHSGVEYNELADKLAKKALGIPVDID